jgi:hypothetical protein
MVSPQYEITNVFATEMNGKTTLYTGGRNEVSRQCELLNDSLIVLLYRWSTQMLCLQYEIFLNVSANDIIGKITLYTGGRYGVSHRCEPSCALSDSLN